MTTLSEDTLIFSALTPGTTNMKKVYEALEQFLSMKKTADASDRFNIILFQENGPNYLNEFTLNPENILLALKTLEPTIVEANIAGGIFVAVSFIIDVYKEISHKAFRLIILSDSGSLKIPENNMPVLENLIDKVKNMPFFIDIVRLNVDDPEEDKKLMDLASASYGGVHEINDMSNLESILEVLALKREIPEESFYDEGPRRIPESDHPFYVNLAQKPVDFNQDGTCSICYQKDNNNLVKCPSCQAVAHKSCFAQWAETSNIGIRNVFRCHNCYNLLTLDRDYIDRVRYGRIVANGMIKIEEIDLQEYQEKIESTEQLEIIQSEDPLYMASQEKKKKKEETKHESIKFLLCPGCYKMITSKYSVCPNCGFHIKEEKD